MSSALNIGANALSTNLAALQVIGHNIANANTAGYSRQTVNTQSAGYQQLGGNYFGKGVELGTVSRSHDAYLTREAQLATSVAAADAERLAKLTKLESLFPTGASGLGAAMNDMLNAWSDVASAPTNQSARVVVIARADELAARLRDTAGQMDALAYGAQQQVESSVTAVNRLAQDIATINQRIIDTGNSRGEPNDLLDQRDALLSELNQYVQTSTVAADDGSVSVFVAGSQPLVLGRQANALVATRDTTDNSQLRVSFVQGGVTRELPQTALGGQIGGDLAFLNEDLPEMQNLLGRMALALNTEINTQHNLGVDQLGNAGGDFFAPAADAAGLPAASNTGTAQIHSEVSDPTALMASDYRVQFEAAGVSIQRLSDGVSTSFASLPAELDGLSFQLDAGASAVGDSFLVRPYVNVARAMNLAIGSPDRLAAASPVAVTPGTANASGLSIESLYATDPSANLTDPVNITFLADGSFTATGLGPGNPPPDNAGPPASYNYTPGQPIQFNGWSLTLRGSPSPGDSFDIAAAAAGSTQQNAGNAKAVLALRDQATFEGVALADGYTSVLSHLGTQVQGAKFSASFSGQLATSTETARAAVSGVNLDEEAARLLQFQQAYQASAKFLQIAQSTFDTLLQTVGR
ncbi:MAG: flagellar hook-associated protein FlgK [Burkholderiales bacterium GWF1_66_17]|uniref:flagellar hook-associated protein FlgK n=1 Tax=Hydrogenophaga sp. TaxID=1904254 RepID=UPI0008B54272|nr:flagellar hook-associated protein FlgK [Hydrogenophaga sp.]OGA75063.1 MAG: flagellar hook-associated protein FlgK [Burkholderiales bacterium GWE1_65_30]OGA90898.1 MAG: flagellar hook-associated protein FlgK [Burkholderiales bacterium GWF1_66_17]HBU17288.1 flagellar hook-associated protein FlgK [Hydrogenophaga sp.]